jgi:hypothetical protein
MTGPPELSVREGYPRPLSLPQGEFRCRLVNVNGYIGEWPE